MSEEVILNGKIEETPKDIVLKITMSRERGLEVEGPGNGTYFDEMMCFFLFEKAKDHIKTSNAIQAKKEKPLITSAGRIRGLFKK